MRYFSSSSFINAGQITNEMRVKKNTNANRCLFFPLRLLKETIWKPSSWPLRTSWKDSFSQNGKNKWQLATFRIDWVFFFFGLAMTWIMKWTLPLLFLARLSASLSQIVLLEQNYCHRYHCHYNSWYFVGRLSKSIRSISSDSHPKKKVLHAKAWQRRKEAQKNKIK